MKHHNTTNCNEGYGSTEVMSVSVTWPHVTKKLGLLGTLTAETSLYIQD